MIDANNRGVLIDFDSCNLYGHKFAIGSKMGTIDWTRDTQVSEWENDFYSLVKVTEWVEKKAEGTAFV